MTYRDLFKGSLRLIGALASGETPAADELTDGLSSFNQMLEAWSTNELLVYTRTILEFTLVSSQQTFTIGTGGDFDTSRPQMIEAANIKDLSADPAAEYPIEIVNIDQWNEIPVKGTSSPLPAKLYADNAFPLVNLNLWPIPSSPNKLVLTMWQQLSTIADPSAELSFPPGYAKALRYNHAVELAAEYGRQIPPEVAAIAADSKGDIKRMNIRPSYLGVDEALLNSGARRYNIYRGSSGT